MFATDTAWKAIRKTKIMKKELKTQQISWKHLRIHNCNNI